MMISKMRPVASRELLGLASFVLLLGVGCGGGTTAVDGTDGTNGTNCTVVVNADASSTISCDDGTTATVAGGTVGNDGTSCSVVDNMDGTKTINCTDGTSATVGDGDDCTVVDNTDGTYTVTCGTDVVVLSDGTDIDPAVLADIQAKLNAAANVDAEACAVCHDGAGAEHQAIYDNYADASKLGLTIDSVLATADPACTTIVTCTDSSDCDTGVTCTAGVCVGQDDNACKDGTCDSVTAGVGVCTAEFGITMTFTITKNGGVYVTTKAEFLAMKQRTFYVASYDATTGEFPLSQSLSRNTAVATGTAGQFTVTAIAGFDPTVNGHGYAYITDGLLDTESGGHVHMYDDVANAGLAFGTAISTPYQSKANISGCEKCHGAPYMKHGYRDPLVAGLGDFASCKSCHYDTRNGGHEDWQILADNPVRYAEVHAGDPLTTAEETLYGYKANLMNDVHMAHAMEFPYPQSMSTCATCHDGKLGNGDPGDPGILSDDNFVRETCRSCHALTGSTDWISCTTIVDCDADTDCTDGSCDNIDPTTGEGECVGEDENRCWDQTCDNVTAGVGECVGEDIYGTSDTAMEQIWRRKGTTAMALHNIAMLTDSAQPECNAACHKTGGLTGATRLKDLHNGGYDPQIYAVADGTKWSDAFVGTIDAASYNSTTNVLTVDFSIVENGTHAPDPADIIPTLMLGLYGYDTKQYIVYTHGRDANRERLLEVEITAGTATVHPRFTVLSAANGVYQVAADLSMWALTTCTADTDCADLTCDNIVAGTGECVGEAVLTNGVVRRIEIGFMPDLPVIIGADDDVVNADADLTNNEHDDFMAALNAPSRTFVLASGTFDDTFANVVDETKCDACHDALATTFHSPKRGGNVKICKMCHVSSSRGSHLELQSRGIDSYVHAIHSFQPFDPANVDFTDPVEAVRYNLHIEHVFPNFTIKNCEACHNPGTYNVPDQSKSLPAVMSATDSFDRNIGDYPQMVVGPAANACGSCHRAHKLTEDDAGGLAAFMSHLESGGFMIEDASGVWNTVVTTILSIFE